MAEAAFVIALVALGISLFTLGGLLAIVRRWPSRPFHIESDPLPLKLDQNTNLYRVSPGVLRTDKGKDE